MAAATATEMVVRATRRPHLLLLLSRFSSFLSRSSSSRAVVSFVRASLLSPPPRKLPCFGTLDPFSLSLLAAEKGGARRAALYIYSRGSCHFFSREGAIADRDHRFPLLVPLELAHRLPRARDLSFYCPRPHGLSDPWKIAATPPRVFSGERRRERERKRSDGEKDRSGYYYNKGGNWPAR